MKAGPHPDHVEAAAGWEYMNRQAIAHLEQLVAQIKAGWIDVRSIHSLAETEPAPPRDGDMRYRMTGKVLILRYMDRAG